MTAGPTSPVDASDRRVDAPARTSDGTLPAEHVVRSRDVRAARAFRTIAAFGVVTGLVLAIVAWRFLSDLGRDLDQSLAIGEDASATSVETIDVASEVVVALDEGLATIAVTLDGMSSLTGDTAGVADTTSRLAASLPETFDDVDVALATVQSLGASIDGALRTASRLPLGPDYDPEVSFPDAIGELRAALEPLGEDIDAIATELEDFSDGAGTLGTDLEQIRGDVDRTRRALADSDRLLDDYRRTAVRAELLARTSRGDLDRSLQLARWVSVLVAVLIIVSQYVPWWLSRAIEGRGGELVSRVAPTGIGAAAVSDEQPISEGRRWTDDATEPITRPTTEVDDHGTPRHR